LSGFQKKPGSVASGGKNNSALNLSVPLGNAVTLLMNRRMASSLLLLMVVPTLLQPAR
jgi:hypothetical protein